MIQQEERLFIHLSIIIVLRYPTKKIVCYTVKDKDLIY